MKTPLQLTCGIFLCCMVSQIQATVVFDTVDAPGTSWNIEGVGVPGGALSGAQQFTTGVSSLNLTNISLMLAASSETAGNMTVRLENNLTGGSVNPEAGAVLYTIYDGPTPTVGAAPAVYTFSGLNYVLSANTSYWISVDFPNYPATGVNWYYDNNDVQPYSEVATQPHLNIYATSGRHDPSWNYLYTTQGLGLAVMAGVVPQLLLSVEKMGTNVTVSWPLGYPAYRLQSAPSLATQASWTNVTQALNTNGSQVSITMPIVSTCQFFRLQQ